MLVFAQFVLSLARKLANPFINAFTNIVVWFLGFCG
jgi:hypothetical protein